MSKDAISFDLSEEQERRLAQIREAEVSLSPDVEDDEDEEVATDVTAFSAYNCAWIPPVTRDSKSTE